VIKTSELTPVSTKDAKILQRDFSRFRAQTLYRNTDGRLYYGTFSAPDFPQGAKDVYHTVVEGQDQRLDLISYYYYHTAELWWVIALANNILSPFDDIHIGDLLRVPDFSTVIDVVVV